MQEFHIKRPKELVCQLGTAPICYMGICISSSLDYIANYAEDVQQTISYWLQSQHQLPSASAQQKVHWGIAYNPPCMQPQQSWECQEGTCSIHSWVLRFERSMKTAQHITFRAQQKQFRGSGFYELISRCNSIVVLKRSSKNVKLRVVEQGQKFTIFSHGNVK